MGMYLMKRTAGVKARFPPCKKCRYIHQNSKVCPKVTSKDPVNRVMALKKKDIDKELDSMDWGSMK